MSSLLFLPGKVFALIIGAFYSKYLPLPYRLVLVLIAVALLCESYGYYLSHFLHKSNAWVFNFYMLVEVWLLGISAVYFVISNKIKKSFFILLIANTIIWLVVIATNSIYVFANASMVSSCCVITIMYIVVLYTRCLFIDQSILKQPIFWVSISTIIYYACDIPYMGLHNYLVQHSPALGVQLANINMVLDRIRYPLVAISFILLGRRKQVGLTAA